MQKWGGKKNGKKKKPTRLSETEISSQTIDRYFTCIWWDFQCGGNAEDEQKKKRKKTPLRTETDFYSYILRNTVSTNYSESFYLKGSRIIESERKNIWDLRTSLFRKNIMKAAGLHCKSPQKSCVCEKLSNTFSWFPHKPPHTHRCHSVFHITE